MTDTQPSELIAPLYRLSADSSLQPAPPNEPEHPPHVGGMPAYYYWKDALVVGQYAHPAGRFQLDITRNRLARFADTFAVMKSNGVGVPIVRDHAETADATLGWIVDVKLDGDRLLELHQFLGDSARDIGLRNKVSLGIDPDFVDGAGRRYGEAIVHSAVTPVPVVPGQGDFEPLQIHLADGPRDVLTLSLSVPAVTPPPAQDDHARGLSILADAVAVRRDAAVAQGAITPAVAHELYRLLARSDSGELRTLCLSRRSDDHSAPPLALAVFDALARNTPVPLGEITGLQVLSRMVPGQSDADVLKRQMIALASGA